MATVPYSASCDFRGTLKRRSRSALARFALFPFLFAHNFDRSTSVHECSADRRWSVYCIEARGTSKRVCRLVLFKSPVRALPWSGRVQLAIYVGKLKVSSRGSVVASLPFLSRGRKNVANFTSLLLRLGL